jgi:hypothetical protein
MKPTPLTQEEQRIVHNEDELVYLEIIKGMSIEELKHFDIYKPTNLGHYLLVQKTWLETERYLILQRVKKDISELELIADAEQNHNFERFKVWYVFHHPDKIRRVE